MSTELVEVADRRADEIARKFANRAGLRLVNYREVGLPFWEINLRCLTLAHRDLPPLQEFCLKTIDADLRTTERIAQFLGLQESHAIATVADLISREYVVPGADLGGQTALELTRIGRRALEELTELAPEERVYPIFFDGITRRILRPGTVTPYDRSEIRKEGLDEIPAFPKDAPEVDQIEASELAALLKDAARTAEIPRDLLAILAIEGNRRRMFQRAVALIYESLPGGDVLVEFAVDGRLAEEHSRAFAAAEGVRKMGIMRTLRGTADDASQILPVEVLGNAAEASEVRALRDSTERYKEEITGLERRLITNPDGPERTVIQQELIEATERLALSETALAQMPVRSLEVYEHPSLLRDAMDNASDRILIVSPWIRAGVVTKEFVERLEKALKRGVKVYIGFGAGLDEGASSRDRDAEADLLLLAGRYSNFVLGRLGDTHAKVLVVDARHVIVTSFNWLSFRGDPQMPFRDERGMLVTLPETIDKIFSDFEGRIRIAATQRPG